MSTSLKRFGPRRGFSLLLGLCAAYMFFDCVMMFIEEFPKRSLDAHPEHWWQQFITAFGMVFVIGCILFWGALRLWRTPQIHTDEHPAA